VTTVKTLKRALLFASIPLLSISCCRSSQSEKFSVPVQHNWLFEAGRPAVLRAELGDADSTALEIETVLILDRSLMSEVKDTVLTTSQKVRANSGYTKIRLGRLEPGFYQVNISYTNESGEKQSLDPFNIGCSPEKIVSEKTAKADFDEFWANTLAELATVPMDLQMTLMPENSDSCRNVYRVEYKSLGGVTVGGIYAEPVAEGTYPALVEYMGYGADVYPYHGVDNPETIQFLVSVRDQGIFRDEQQRWIDRGLASKEDFYYRGAFCDAVRAVDFIASREKTDQSRIFGWGESQGGALTWIAASLDHRFRAIAPAVPFLSDYEDYAKIVWWPMWEVFETIEKEGLDKAEVLDMMTYFDVMNFTEKIECPVKMGFGLQDPVCPPHTNFAGYNNVRTEKTWNVYPLCGHGIWQVSEWAEERNRWFKTFESEN